MVFSGVVNCTYFIISITGQGLTCSLIFPDILFWFTFFSFGYSFTTLFINGRYYQPWLIERYWHDPILAVIGFLSLVMSLRVCVTPSFTRGCKIRTLLFYKNVHF